MTDPDRMIRFHAWQAQRRANEQALLAANREERDPEPHLSRVMLAAFADMETARAFAERARTEHDPETAAVFDRRADRCGALGIACHATREARRARELGQRSGVALADIQQGLALAHRLARQSRPGALHRRPAPRQCGGWE
jgi:hypothetical protein